MPAIDPKRADGGEHPDKPGWPEGVEPVSLEDIGKLGIHQVSENIGARAEFVLRDDRGSVPVQLPGAAMAWATVASALIGAVALLHQVYVNLP
ncbi:hypothetical protein [Mesorhizobium sp. 1M-11]|uniref:hypothetical protein n=1 Tax=Mesorhizobium sp. 1M-11 TaxID=1529006 RepID=UPI0006C741BE|nr:hypothetical protein [Mesorhizobium sp. 1M-11]